VQDSDLRSLNAILIDLSGQDLAVNDSIRILEKLGN